MKMDYEKMLDRIVGIVEESGSSKISADITNNIYCWNCVGLEEAIEFCEYYGCSLDYLAGRSDVYSMI